MQNRCKIPKISPKSVSGGFSGMEKSGKIKGEEKFQKIGDP